MKMMAAVLSMSLIPMFAQANIVCEGTSSATGSKFSVEIAENQVTVSGGLLSKPRVFKQLTEVNGLITAAGLAVTMKNEYGCMRDATIITELREPINAGYMETLHVDTCKGGSTPDQLCLPRE